MIVKAINSYNETPEVASDYSSQSVPSFIQGTSQAPGGLLGSYFRNNLQENLQFPGYWHHGNWRDVHEPERFLGKDSIKEKGKSEK